MKKLKIYSGKNKPGRPPAKIEPEYPVDGLEDEPQQSWEDLPGGCQDCIWLCGSEYPKCMVFTELVRVCPARVVDKLEALKLLDSMEEYARKKDLTVEDNETLGQIKALKEDLEAGRLKYEGWRACYYADLHRGKRGGGGEQEKAPNKPKLKKPLRGGLSFVEPFHGIEG